MRDCTAKLGRQGEFTLPHRLRRKYGLAEGDVLSLLDLGGLILLSPKSSTVAGRTAEMERLRREAGVSIAELVGGVHRERGRRK